jgi:hypothetical protein
MGKEMLGLSKAQRFALEALMQLFSPGRVL